MLETMMKLYKLPLQHLSYSTHVLFDKAAVSASPKTAFSKLKMRSKNVQVPLFYAEHELRPVDSYSGLRRCPRTCPLVSIGVRRPLRLSSSRRRSRGPRARRVEPERFAVLDAVAVCGFQSHPARV